MGGMTGEGDFLVQKSEDHTLLPIEARWLGVVDASDSDENPELHPEEQVTLGPNKGHGDQITSLHTDTVMR